MNWRTTENEAAYQTYKKAYVGDCMFCELSEREPSQILEINATMMVIENRYPYAHWDNFDVGDHRMIIPKEHRSSLDEFTNEEQTDYFDLLKKFEARHYSVYARAPSNKSRTIYHLHTHLIRPADI